MSYETAAPPRLAFTIEEFCKSHGISRALFYKMRKAGIGPRLGKVGTKTLISVEAAQVWRREREQSMPTAEAVL